MHNYWLSANNNSLHVTGAQVARAAPKSVLKEGEAPLLTITLLSCSMHCTALSTWFVAAIQDHIILGTDNYYTSPRTKWDQFIGERPPRTRGIPGQRFMTACQTHAFTNCLCGEVWAVREPSKQSYKLTLTKRGICTCSLLNQFFADHYESNQSNGCKLR